MRKVSEWGYKILELLENYPEGLWFNEITRKMKGIPTGPTISKILSKYLEEGMVVKEPKIPRKGQKAFYRLSESRIKLNEAIDELNYSRKLIKDTLNLFHFNLDKGRIKLNQSLADDFYRYFYDQIAAMLFKVEYLSRPFPKKFQEQLFERGFSILRDVSLHLFSILRRYLNNGLIVSFHLHEPRQFYAMIEDKEEYEKWLAEVGLED